MQKIYYIVGASSDVGMSYIRHLNNISSNKELVVIAHYRTMKPSFEKMISECVKINILPIRADLDERDEVLSMIDDLSSKELYPTHVFLAAAADFYYCKIKDFDYSRMKRMLNISIMSYMEILKWILPNMEKNNYGKIVVMLSSYTLGLPPKYMADYCITKHALLGLVKAVASEYGELGISINGISPNMIDTHFISKLGRKVKEAAAETNPKHRLLTPDDLIAPIDFLLSDEAEFMNGCNMDFSGIVH